MRFEGDGDEDFPGQWGLWEHTLTRCFSGAAGQKKLRELREALLALPEPKLISTRIADEQGHCCAIGALARHSMLKQGMSEAEVISCLAGIVDEEMVWDGWAVERETLALAKSLGVKSVMAVDIAYRNDEYHRHEFSDEDRYASMMRWLDTVIFEEVPA